MKRFLIFPALAAITLTGCCMAAVRGNIPLDVPGRADVDGPPPDPREWCLNAGPNSEWVWGTDPTRSEAPDCSVYLRPAGVFVKDGVCPPGLVILGVHCVWP